MTAKSKVWLLLLLSGCAGRARQSPPLDPDPTPSYVEETTQHEQALARVLDESVVLDCGEANRLRDQICQLADRICGVAERRPERANLCKDSRDRCDRATERVKQRCPAEASEAPIPIIDVHTHTKFSGGTEETSGIPLTEAQYFAELTAAGVIGAVAHTTETGEEYADLRANGVIHCAGVEAIVDVERLEKGLSTGKYGCIKVYLGYVHQFAADPNYLPVYRLAEKYDVPVVFHSGDTYSTKAKLKYADPLTIDEVAVDHPNVRFVIAHCGNPWIQSAAEVAYKNPNVYLECSALLIGDLSDERAVQKYVIEPIQWILGYVESPRKLMFGSDWPLVNIAAYAALYRRAIPREYQRAVFYDNAVRVFKIK